MELIIKENKIQQCLKFSGIHQMYVIFWMNVKNVM